MNKSGEWIERYPNKRNKTELKEVNGETKIPKNPKNNKTKHLRVKAEGGNIEGDTICRNTTFSQIHWLGTTMTCKKKV